jgi:hypothetical protein
MTVKELQRALTFFPDDMKVQICVNQHNRKRPVVCLNPELIVWSDLHPVNGDALSIHITLPVDYKKKQIMVVKNVKM